LPIIRQPDTLRQSHIGFVSRTSPSIQAVSEPQRFQPLIPDARPTRLASFRIFYPGSTALIAGQSSASPSSFREPVPIVQPLLNPNTFSPLPPVPAPPNWLRLAFFLICVHLRLSAANPALRRVQTPPEPQHFPAHYPGARTLRNWLRSAFLSGFNGAYLRPIQRFAGFVSRASPHRPTPSEPQHFRPLTPGARSTQLASFRILSYLRLSAAKDRFLLLELRSRPANPGFSRTA
jgi:hypothetical protein